MLRRFSRWALCFILFYFGVNLGLAFNVFSMIFTEWSFWMEFLASYLLDIHP